MRIELADVGCTIYADHGDRLEHCQRSEVVDLVRRQGFVRFTGFPVTATGYEAFTSRFGACADTRHVHYPESGAGLGFHAEDAYNPYRPDALWFYCAYQGSDGGVPTGVVDGAELLAALPPKWQWFSRVSGMRFDRQWAAPVWRDAAPVTGRTALESVLASIPNLEFDFLPDGTLYLGYQVPFVVRTAGGQESFSNTLLQAVTDQEFYGMMLTDGWPVPDELVGLVTRLARERERDLDWRTGDVAVIDNLRIMHRRRGYQQHDRDLRARHCEDFFGSWQPDATTPLQAWVKSLIQGDVALPTRVGRPEPAPAAFAAVRSPVARRERTVPSAARGV